MRYTLAGLILTAAAAVALPLGLRAAVHTQVARRIYSDVGSVPPAPVALVLGAGLWKDGSPTPVLYDRVATGAALYRAGIVKKLLMSGDNRFVNYNEPAVMKSVALALGVPAADIVLDYAGRRTYDSCYRAREIFQVKRLVVVTQRFHLDRAIFLCDALGLDAVGVTADRRAYPRLNYFSWELRELPALVNAWWDVKVGHPVPVLGDKLPIKTD